MEDFVRRALEPGGKSAGAYFRRQWLTRTTRSLAEVRRSAGLTQAQVAAKMGTTQSAIARMENDLSGGVSLRRYVDFLVACGVMPLLPETKSLEDLREAGLQDTSVSPLEPRRWSVTDRKVERVGLGWHGSVHATTLPAAADLLLDTLELDTTSSPSYAESQDGRPRVFDEAEYVVARTEERTGYRLGGPIRTTRGGSSTAWMAEPEGEELSDSVPSEWEATSTMASEEAAA